MKTTVAQLQQQHMTCTDGQPGQFVRWADEWFDCSCGWGCEAENVLQWFEEPIRITRDGLGGYRVSNGENGGDRLPERHYWPKTA